MNWKKNIIADIQNVLITKEDNPNKFYYKKHIYKSNGLKHGSPASIKYDIYDNVTSKKYYNLGKLYRSPKYSGSEKLYDRPAIIRFEPYDLYLIYEKYYNKKGKLHRNPSDEYNSLTYEEKRYGTRCNGGPAAIYYHPNGNVFMEIYYHNGKMRRFGEEHLPAIIQYYEDGRISYEKYYGTKGKPHRAPMCTKEDLWKPAIIWYYENGNIKEMEYSYNGNIPTIFGKLDKPYYVEYYENGNIKMERYEYRSIKMGPYISIYNQDGTKNKEYYNTNYRLTEECDKDTFINKTPTEVHYNGFNICKIYRYIIIKDGVTLRKIYYNYTN